MTSLLRRKRRTTAPRTTRAGTPCRLALLAALACGGTADAQPAAGRPQQPVQQFQNGLYAPPGYRQRTPPPSVERPAAERPGSNGKVMYFHKPADALLGADADDSGVAVAAGQLPPLPSGGVPDVPVSTPGNLLHTPRAVPSAGSPVLPTPSALPATRALPVARPGRPAVGPQDPPSSTSDKQPLALAAPDPSVTQVPSPERIFQMYNDTQLARKVAESVREQRVKTEEAKRLKGEMPIVVPPVEDPEWQFPTPAQVNVDGTPYRPKTSKYAPRQVLIEPSYVAHRRLHFEEKNAERYGWDLGIIQPAVSTMYFYRDTLLWPNSLMSGFVHGFWDTSAGKCQPGSPVPYMLYPPGLTITGTAAEAGLITGLSFVFP